MCLYSRRMVNKKYTPNQKNGGIVPAVNDPRTLWIETTCGNCIECRKKKSREWQIRLMEDIKQNRNGHMITLTLSTESIIQIMEKIPKELTGYDRDNKIAKYAVRHWLERWRKKYKRSIRHWLITELGHKGTENIHIHGIIWTNEPRVEIEKTWQYGWIWPRYEQDWQRGYVTEKTINYITKYVTKRDIQHKTYKPIILTTGGIGRHYAESENAKRNKFNESETDQTYRTRTGHKIAIPTYWRNKIYNDDEREALWRHGMDKEEKWICGMKIDISKDLKNYWKTRQWYRQLNAEQGYGTSYTSVAQKEYENMRREKILQERIIKKRILGIPQWIPIDKDWTY